MKRWLHADADMFFAAVEIVKNPALKGNQLLWGNQLKAWLVSTASYEARKLNSLAVPISVARRLLPDAVYLEGDYASYQSYSGNMFSCSISIPLPYVDYRSMKQIWILLQRFIFMGRRNPCIAVKSDIATSLALRYLSEFPPPDLLQNPASQAKPDGLTIVMEGSEKHFWLICPSGYYTESKKS